MESATIYLLIRGYVSNTPFVMVSKTLTLFSDAPYSAHRESLISSSSAFMQHEGERYAGDYHHSTSANSPILCSRCKRSATTDQANNLYSSETASNRIGSSSNETSELILVAQTAAAELTKILNTLNLGLFFVRRGCNHVSFVHTQVTCIFAARFPILV
jgi:hypothetical protein